MCWQCGVILVLNRLSLSVLAVLMRDVPFVQFHCQLRDSAGFLEHNYYLPAINGELNIVLASVS